MTQPDEYTPPTAANYASLAGHAATSREDWETQIHDNIESHFLGAEDGFHTRYMAELYSASRLSQLRAQRYATDASGVVVSADFNGASAGNLGGSFSRSSFDVGAGDFGPDGAGFAVWKKSGGLGRGHLDRHTTALSSDYQFVSTVIASPPQSPYLGAEGYTYLRGRINSDQTTWTGLRIGYNTLAVVCMVDSDFTVLDTVSFTPRETNAFDFYLGTDGDDREFVAHCNGAAVDWGAGVYSVVDSGDVSQLGASYLYAGLGASAGDRGVGILAYLDQTVPCDLDSWAAADRLATAL